jgi:hypothetical protein
MKKNFYKFIFASLLTLICLTNLNAQTTTWDFTASNPSWPAAGMGTNPIQIVDSKGLGLYGISTNANFAAWNSTSSSTWAAPNDAYSGSFRVQTNGAGFAGGANESTPTQRYFFIQVNQACTVKVWFKSGSSGASRSVIVSNGTTNYGKATANTTPPATGIPSDGAYLSASVTAAGTFYLYGDAAVNIFQIQVVGATVSLTPSNPLNTTAPVKFGALNASLSNGLAKISWDVISEINTANYYIEKSDDGRSFASVGSLTATNAPKYSFVDNAPASAIGYYRIKAVDKDGTIGYSNTVKLNNKKSDAAIVVTPNPVTNGLLNLQMNNFSKSAYTVALYDFTGKQVFVKSVSVENGTSSQSIELPSSVTKGIYQLQVTNGAVKLNKSVVVQ